MINLNRKTHKSDNADHCDVKINCTKCGDCCRGFSENDGVVLFPEDIETISSRLGVSPKTFKASYCFELKVPTELKEITLYCVRHIEEHCVFLENNLCRIYEFRPMQCKRAPFNFFWGGKLDHEYDCTRNIQIPENLSSSKRDLELLDSLFIET